MKMLLSSYTFAQPFLSWFSVSGDVLFTVSAACYCFSFCVVFAIYCVASVVVCVSFCCCFSAADRRTPKPRKMRAQKGVAQNFALFVPSAVGSLCCCLCSGCASFVAILLLIVLFSLIHLVLSFCFPAVFGAICAAVFGAVCAAVCATFAVCVVFLLFVAAFLVSAACIAVLVALLFLLCMLLLLLCAAFLVVCATACVPVAFCYLFVLFLLLLLLLPLLLLLFLGRRPRNPHPCRCLLWIDDGERVFPLVRRFSGEFRKILHNGKAESKRSVHASELPTSRTRDHCRETPGGRKVSMCIWWDANLESRRIVSTSVAELRSLYSNLRVVPLVDVWGNTGEFLVAHHDASVCQCMVQLMSVELSQSLVSLTFLWASWRRRKCPHSRSPRRGASFSCPSCRAPLAARGWGENEGKEDAQEEGGEVETGESRVKERQPLACMAWRWMWKVQDSTWAWVEWVWWEW